MKIIGITGGIGSGKTFVCHLFRQYNIPVYSSDLRSKIIVNTNSEIRKKIQEYFGKQSYVNKTLNSSHISNIVFSNPYKLNVLNSIVHPEIKKDFIFWLKLQNTPFVIKESALLFETGVYKNCNHIITVVAPMALRIKRIVSRNKLSLDKISQIMNNQADDNLKIEKSDFIIENIHSKDTIKQIKNIYIKMIKLKLY